MININNFLTAYIIIYLLSSISEILLDLLNEIHLKKKGKIVPMGFEGMIDGNKLAEMNAYTIDKIRLTVLQTVISKAVFLYVILSGFMPWLAGAISKYNLFLAGMIFFAVPGIIALLIDLPFDYYQIFRIEERYGFNTRTIRTWISDLIKTIVITAILGAVLLTLLLLMVHYAGRTWWIWAWIIFIAFQILMSILYPTVIAPIFNKFTPIENEELGEKIKSLSDREGLDVEGIFQMDAARRSRHTNAYFTGLGRIKRIVLYDTLLKSHDDEEILAVLAHEMGHLKKGHIKKQLIIMGIVSLILFFLASKMILWSRMYESFGFPIMSAYAGLFLIAVIWEPVGFFLSPLGMALSRRFEREADRHAHRTLGTGRHFVDALKKMALDNLSNLRPHPLYVRFHYSHPPLIERIEVLEDLNTKA